MAVSGGLHAGVRVLQWWVECISGAQGEGGGLQSGQSLSGCGVQQQREQGQGTISRAAGVLGDQHSAQQAGQADATDIAIGNAIRPSVSTICREPESSD